MKTSYGLINFVNFIIDNSLPYKLFRSWDDSTNNATDNSLGKWYELGWNEVAALLVFIEVAEINLKFRC